MKPPYDRSYLDFVVEEQGRLFESLQDDRPEVDSADFIVSYLKSSTRRQLDEGHAYYLTLDAAHLKETFLDESGYVPKAGTPIRGFAPNWIGQFYARFQWETGISSAEALGKVPLKWLVNAYSCLHDLDLGVAVQKVGGGTIERAEDNLKHERIRQEPPHPYGGYARLENKGSLPAGGGM